MINKQKKNVDYCTPQMPQKQVDCCTPLGVSPNRRWSSVYLKKQIHVRSKKGWHTVNLEVHTQIC